MKKFVLKLSFICGFINVVMTLRKFLHVCRLNIISDGSTDGLSILYMGLSRPVVCFYYNPSFLRKQLVEEMAFQTIQGTLYQQTGSSWIFEQCTLLKTKTNPVQHLLQVKEKSLILSTRDLLVTFLLFSEFVCAYRYNVNIF